MAKGENDEKVPAPSEIGKIVYLWREGKIIFGEVEISPGEEHGGPESAGIWFFKGKSGEQFDFRKTVMLAGGRYPHPRSAPPPTDAS